MSEEHPIRRKIIPFPNLQWRLLEKGRESLSKGNVEDAIGYLRDAKEVDPGNEHILYTLAGAYIHQGNLKEAKETLEEMLHSGTGDYFETVELYITVLFQLHEYKKIESLLTMLLEENQIPAHKIQQYKDLYRLAKKMPEEKNRDCKNTEDLFNGDTKTVINQLVRLTKDEILSCMDDFRQFLSDDSKNPFIKTILLNDMKVKGISQTVDVHKFSRKVTINIREYAEVQHVPFTLEVKRLLEKHLAHINPSMYEYAITLCDRFFFTVYPLEMQFQNPKLWAAAITFVVESYMNPGYEPAQTIKIYRDIDEQELKETAQFIKDVDHQFKL